MKGLCIVAALFFGLLSLCPLLREIALSGNMDKEEVENYYSESVL